MRHHCTGLELLDEVTGVVLFLVSDLANYITGKTIEVNGGVLMDQVSTERILQIESMFNFFQKDIQ